MNTAVNPPEAQFDAAPPVVTQPSGPTTEPAWQDSPEPADGGWQDSPEPVPDSINAHAGQVLLGAGKGLAGDVLMGTPAAGLMMSGELGHGLDATNNQQIAGKVAESGAMLLGTGGVEDLVQLAKTGIGKISRSGAIDALHNSLGTHLASAAQEAGVDVKPTDNIRKVVSNVADKVRQVGTEKMDELSSAVQGLKISARGAGGKFMTGTTTELGLPDNLQGFDDQLDKLTKKLQTQSGATNIEARAATQAQIKELSNAKQQVVNALNRQGLGSAHDDAVKMLDQADALDKLKEAHNRATFGLAKDSKTNPVKFAKELEPLHANGTLHAALGNDQAEALSDTANRASRTFTRAQTVQKIGKHAAIALGKGAGMGVGMDVFK
jgi:hypothetical protein